MKAFVEMNRAKTGFIIFEDFSELVRSWGFEAPDLMIKEVFDWLDYDKDTRITFEDIRATLGKYLAPRESLYFRQDRKPGKAVTCKYEKCWENNNFNSKSQYCQLHQKIMRNICLDKFSNISSKASDEEWDNLVKVIIDNDFELTLYQLESSIRE